MHLIWRSGQNTDPKGPRATASVGLGGVNNVHLRAGGVAQVEEGLSSKHRALSSNPSTAPPPNNFVHLNKFLVL
jgi:hypothetical protein